MPSTLNSWRLGKTLPKSVQYKGILQGPEVTFFQARGTSMRQQINPLALNGLFVSHSRLETKLLTFGVRVGSPSRPTHVQTRCVIAVWRLLSIHNWSRRLSAGVGYRLMRTSRSMFVRLVFPIVTCLLVGGILSTEIPELLSLTDVTSNDFTVQPTGAADSGRILRVTMPVVTLIAPTVAQHNETQFAAVAEEGPSSEHLGLFILHSILRR